MASQSQSVLQCSLTQRIVKHPVAQLVMTFPVRDVGVAMASQMAAQNDIKCSVHDDCVAMHCNAVRHKLV